MLNRFMCWAYTQTPAFWEGVSIFAFGIFIIFVVGVN